VDNPFSSAPRSDEEILRVSPDKIEAYLAQSNQRRQSLAAWQAAGDRDACERPLLHPDDPKVQPSVTPWMFSEDRRLRIERFKQSVPENPLANYLSAREISAPDNQTRPCKSWWLPAAGGLGLHRREAPGLEEVQMFAGRTATRPAGSGLLLPHLRPWKELARELHA
jgi:hypothetical protein